MKFREQLLGTAQIADLHASWVCCFWI